ncbi:unnamed protein product [Danaus chrysippus]|uniref:(African queen) hypothetical protein n=1 Tax=Danaus chrysippus TaxID=151541 RepID=A0A8J2VQT8_9NEOP|nr:unnamed protein product [Danaus chrysippus]
MVAFYVLCVRQIGCHDDHAGDATGGKKGLMTPPRKQNGGSVTRGKLTLALIQIISFYCSEDASCVVRARGSMG